MLEIRNGVNNQDTIMAGYQLLDVEDVDMGTSEENHLVWERVIKIFMSISGVNVGWWNENVCCPTTLWRLWHNLTGLYLFGNFVMLIVKLFTGYGYCTSMAMMLGVIYSTSPIAYVLLRTYFGKKFWKALSSKCQGLVGSSAILRKELWIAIFTTASVWIFGTVVQLMDVTYFYNYTVVVDFLKFGVPAILNMFIRITAGLWNLQIADITDDLVHKRLDSLIFIERFRKAIKDFDLLARHMRYWIVIFSFLNMCLFAAGVLKLFTHVPLDHGDNLSVCTSFGPDLKYVAEWAWFFITWLLVMLALAETQKRHLTLISLVNESAIGCSDRMYITNYLKTTELPFEIVDEQITYKNIGKLIYVLVTASFYAIERFN